MHDRNAGFGAGLRQGAGGLGIHAFGQLGLVLGAVHGGIGAGIHDQIGCDTRDQGRQRFRRREIRGFAGAAVGQPAAAGCRHHFAQRRQAAQQLEADLAVAADQQDFHGV